jgi:hypothetical protein
VITHGSYSWQIQIAPILVVTRTTRKLKKSILRYRPFPCIPDTSEAQPIKNSLGTCISQTQSQRHASGSSSLPTIFTIMITLSFWYGKKHTLTPSSSPRHPRTPELAKLSASAFWIITLTRRLSGCRAIGSASLQVGEEAVKEDEGKAPRDLNGSLEMACHDGTVAVNVRLELL